MATRISPTQNTKLGTNSKTISGSTYLTASRTGSGESYSPYVDTIDLASSTKTSITDNTVNKRYLIKIFLVLELKSKK